LKLEHSFTVPADLDTVWQAVLDPERVAPCMPGATLTEVDGDAFKGSVKVKMGPISLLYKGTGEFLTKDADTGTVVIKAAGKDARGNGTASATVTVTLKAAGSSTIGSVNTNLSITGKPAQFGRGLISEVGGKILDSFATCLASKLAPTAEEPPKLSLVADPATTEPPVTEPTTTEPTAEPAAAKSPAEPTATESTTAESTTAESTTAKPSAAKSSTEPTAAGSTVAKPAAKSSAEPAVAKPTVATAAEKTAATATATAQHAEARKIGKQAGQETATHAPPATKPKLAAAPEPETEPIDLLAYAGPSVLKRAIPLLALIAAVLAFIALRRRH
jgi:carbon monoxide dehydrogenase subunit G